MKEFNLRMVLTGKDAGASNLLRQWSQKIKQTNDDAVKSTQQSAQQQNNVTRNAMRTRQRDMAAMGKLGVRSEREIQREINMTIAAYNRLAKSGTVSQKELQRAARATKEQVAGLRQELGQTTKMGRLMNGGRVVAGMAAATVAAGAVLDEPLKKRRSFDLELAYAANTAYAERDVQGRIAGKQDLYGSVKNAVQVGGGNREDALSGLNTMIASGSVKIEVAKNLLPTLQKAAVGSGGTTDDMARIAIAAMQNFGINESQITEVLDKAVASGQAGNFELNDMARWLPQQLAAAQNAGMSGMADFETILRANQQARTTAGTSDEAGNNLVNLLAKITSQDAVGKFKKVEYRDTDGKIKGIDLTQSLLDRKAKGENTIDAFIGIIDKMMTSNKQYQQLQEQINKAKGEEKQQLLSQQASILEGTAIGEVVADRQALMALLGIRNSKDLGGEVSEAITNSKGSIDTAHAVIMDTTSAKAQNKDNARDFAQMESLKTFDEALGGINQTLADYAAKYPELSAVMAGSELAIKALAAAAFSASIAVAMMGKNPLDYLPGNKGPGGGGPTSSGGKAGGLGGLGKWLGGLVKYGKWGAGAGLMLHSDELGGGLDVMPDGKGGFIQRSKYYDPANPTEKQKAKPPVQPQYVDPATRQPWQPKQVQPLQPGRWQNIQTTRPPVAELARAQPPRESLADLLKKLQPQGNNSFAKAAQVGQNMGMSNVKPLDASTYQAGVRESSATIGNQLQQIDSRLAGQQQTIQNNMQVSIDGRVVAEQVAKYQVAMFGRGAAQ